MTEKSFFDLLRAYRIIETWGRVEQERLSSSRSGVLDASAGAGTCNWSGDRRFLARRRRWDLPEALETHLEVELMIDRYARDAFRQTGPRNASRDRLVRLLRWRFGSRRDASAFRCRQLDRLVAQQKDRRFARVFVQGAMVRELSRFIRYVSEQFS